MKIDFVSDVACPWCAVGLHALEEALRLKDRFGGRVTMLCMGPPQAEDALRKCVSFGATDAILITDRALGNARSAADSAAVRGRPFVLTPVGANTDYAAFTMHLGVSALHVAYRNTVEKIRTSYDDLQRDFARHGITFRDPEAQIERGIGAAGVSRAQLGIGL